MPQQWSSLPLPFAFSPLWPPLQPASFRHPFPPPKPRSGKWRCSKFERGSLWRSGKKSVFWCCLVFLVHTYSRVSMFWSTLLLDLWFFKKPVKPGISLGPNSVVIFNTFCNPFCGLDHSDFRKSFPISGLLKIWLFPYPLPIGFPPNYTFGNDKLSKFATYNLSQDKLSWCV